MQIKPRPFKGDFAIARLKQSCISHLSPHAAASGAKHRDRHERKFQLRLEINLSAVLSLASQLSPWSCCHLSRSSDCQDSDRVVDAAGERACSEKILSLWVQGGCWSKRWGTRELSRRRMPRSVLLHDPGKKKSSLLSASPTGPHAIDTGVGRLVAWPPALLHGLSAWWHQDKAPCYRTW